MQNDCLLTGLSDTDLLSRASSLARDGRRLTAQLVVHLAEIDARRLYLQAGHSSLFAYCCTVLRLSEYAAYARIEAARVGRRFPYAFELLEADAVTLTTVAVLGRYLTAENHREVLEAARGMSKAEAEVLAARLAPRGDAAPSLRKVAVKPAPAAPPSVPAVGPPAPGVAAPPSAAVAPPAAAVVAPLSPERYRWQMTIDGDTLDLLKMARELLGHSIAPGDDAALLRRALEALVAGLARKKYAAATNPRDAKPGAEHSRHVPAGVKRAVWVRDRGRCTYRAPDGRRCDERRATEFHHVRPYMAGGEMSVENIRLLCRAHNQHESRRFYGRAEAGGTTSWAGAAGGTAARAGVTGGAGCQSAVVGGP